MRRPMYAIKVDNVSKWFGRGKKKSRALKNVNLEVRPNQIFGLLGENGAGKTTLLSIIATTLSAEEGTVEVYGYNTTKKKFQVRELVNIVSGYSGIHFDFSVWENMLLYSKLHGVKNIDWLNKLLRLVKLEDKKAIRGDDLSVGMRQRLGIALSLINKPRVLLLDEPTAGLDPIIAQRIRNRILSIQKALGMTIILTTHNLHEAEMLCDKIAIIKNGRILVVKPTKELKESLGNRQIIEVITKEKLPALNCKGVIKKIKKGKMTLLVVKNIEKNIIPILKKLEKYGFEKIELEK